MMIYLHKSPINRQELIDPDKDNKISTQLFKVFKSRLIKVKDPLSKLVKK